MAAGWFYPHAPLLLPTTTAVSYLRAVLCLTKGSAYLTVARRKGGNKRLALLEQEQVDKRHLVLLLLNSIPFGGKVSEIRLLTMGEDIRLTLDRDTTTTRLAHSSCKQLPTLSPRTLDGTLHTFSTWSHHQAFPGTEFMHPSLGDPGGGS